MLTEYPAVVIKALATSHCRERVKFGWFKERQKIEILYTFHEYCTTFKGAKKNYCRRWGYVVVTVSDTQNLTLRFNKK